MTTSQQTEPDYDEIINGPHSDTETTTTDVPKNPPKPDEKSDDTNEDKFDEEPGIPTLSLKDKSDIYIISVDNIPQCYTTTLENARVRMWDLARYVKAQESQFHRCYLREEGNRNSIQLNGTSRFLIISYDHILVRFSINHIKELEEVKDTEIQDKYDIMNTPEEDSSRFATLMKTITG